MGRNKKTKKLQDLQGTSRPDRQRSDEVGFTSIAAVPDPPPSLGEYGVGIWVLLCQELIAAKILKVTDLLLLEIFVSALEDYRECCDKLKGRSKILIGADKKPTPNPYVKLKRQYGDIISKHVGHFGFSPLTRVKIAALAAGGGDPKPDPFAAFLFGEAEEI